MVIRRALLILASTLMAVTAWTAASPSPAYAAYDNSTCTSSTYGCVGAAYWHSNGDTMEVCDFAADGFSVVAVTWIDGWSNWQYKWHTAGAGGCTDRSFGNLPEGKDLWFMACLGDYSDNLIIWNSCGTEVYGEA